MISYWYTEIDDDDDDNYMIIHILYIYHMIWYWNTEIDDDDGMIHIFL